MDRMYSRFAGVSIPRSFPFRSMIPGSRVPSGRISPSNATKSRDSMTRSRTASCAASSWDLARGEGRSVFRVMRVRYSKAVDEDVRMKFLA